MASYNNPPYPDEGAPSFGHKPSMTAAASAISAVDNRTFQLYRRARTSGPKFASITAEARDLHTALKHLRLEAEDADSVLARDRASRGPDSVSARRLARLIEDCDFTLQEVDTLLERYGANLGAENGLEQGGTTSRASMPAEIDARGESTIARVRDRLAARKNDIDAFLDTVQLPTPIQARQNLDRANGQQLDSIKDKVDAIAQRLYVRRHAAGYLGDEEALWVQFRTELEREGFSKEVLRKNQVRSHPLVLS
jgi:hypothetical protein